MAIQGNPVSIQPRSHSTTTHAAGATNSINHGSPCDRREINHPPSAVIAAMISARPTISSNAIHSAALPNTCTDM